MKETILRIFRILGVLFRSIRVVFGHKVSGRRQHKVCSRTHACHIVKEESYDSESNSVLESRRNKKNQ